MKPTERQRTLTGAMCWAPDPPTEPGHLDGPVRVLVAAGMPLCSEGRALMRRYNANPPAEERAPIQTMTTAMATKRARRRG